MIKSPADGRSIAAEGIDAAGRASHRCRIASYCVAATAALGGRGGLPGPRAGPGPSSVAVPPPRPAARPTQPSPTHRGDAHGSHGAGRRAVAGAKHAEPPDGKTTGLP